MVFLSFEPLTGIARGYDACKVYRIVGGYIVETKVESVSVWLWFMDVDSLRARTRVELLDVVVDIDILNVGSQRVGTDEFRCLRFSASGGHMG